MPLTIELALVDSATKAIVSVMATYTTATTNVTETNKATALSIVHVQAT